MFNAPLVEALQPIPSHNQAYSDKILLAYPYLFF